MQKRIFSQGIVALIGLVALAPMAPDSIAAIANTAKPATGSALDHVTLSAEQQALLAGKRWTALSDEQRMVFLVISADTAALGIDLSEFVLSGITIAGVDGSMQTELNLVVSDPLIAHAAVLRLEASARARFAAWPKAWLVGPPHPGYRGNLRQNVVRWSMQLSTNADTGAVQIDIDPFNPNSWGVFGHWLDVFRHRVTRRDTGYNEVAAALVKRGVRIPVNGGGSPLASTAAGL